MAIMKKIWYILLLIFSKSAFARAEHKHSSVEIEEAEKRIAKKQTGYSVSFFYVASALGLGYLTAEFLNERYELSWDAVRLIRFISIFILGWAILSRFGYETETYDESTLLELSSRNSYKVFYIIGIFLITVALFINAK